MARIDYAEHFECDDCEEDQPCGMHEMAASEWYEDHEPDKDR